MPQRLVPLLLALTIAAVAAVRPPCCCATPGVSEACCQARSAEAKAELPPCCQHSDSCSSNQAPPQGPCGCADCPANQPNEPLANSTTDGETEPTQDTPAITARVSLRPPLDQRLVSCVAMVPVSLESPPPDRQALLGVWTI